MLIYALIVVLLAVPCAMALRARAALAPVLIPALERVRKVTKAQ